MKLLVILAILLGFGVADGDSAALRPVKTHRARPELHNPTVVQRRGLAIPKCHLREIPRAFNVSSPSVNRIQRCCEHLAVSRVDFANSKGGRAPPLTG